MTINVKYAIHQYEQRTPEEQRNIEMGIVEETPLKKTTHYAKGILSVHTIIEATGMVVIRQREGEDPQIWLLYHPADPITILYEEEVYKQIYSFMNPPINDGSEETIQN